MSNQMNQAAPLVVGHEEECFRNMNLHEARRIKGDVCALRVPGGWIYEFSSAQVSHVFVPELSLKQSRARSIPMTQNEKRG